MSNMLLDHYMVTNICPINIYRQIYQTIIVFTKEVGVDTQTVSLPVYRLL